MIDNYIKQWLIKANHDIKTVQIGLNQSDDEIKEISDVLCFHCQQAIEKYLKAFLIIIPTDYGHVDRQCKQRRFLCYFIVVRT